MLTPRSLSALPQGALATSATAHVTPCEDSILLRIRGPAGGSACGSADSMPSLWRFVKASFENTGLPSIAWASSANGWQADVRIYRPLLNRCGLLADLVSPSSSQMQSPVSSGTQCNDDDDELSTTALAAHGAVPLHQSSKPPSPLMKSNSSGDGEGVRLKVPCCAWRLLDVILLLVQPTAVTASIMNHGSAFVETLHMADFIRSEDALMVSMARLHTLLAAFRHETQAEAMYAFRELLVALDTLPHALQIAIAERHGPAATLLFRPPLFTAWARSCCDLDLRGSALSPRQLLAMDCVLTMLPHVHSLRVALSSASASLEPLTAVLSYLPKLKVLAVVNSPTLMEGEGRGSEAWGRLLRRVSTTLVELDLRGTACRIVPEFVRWKFSEGDLGALDGLLLHCQMIIWLKILNLGSGLSSPLYCSSAAAHIEGMFAGRGVEVVL